MGNESETSAPRRGKRPPCIGILADRLEDYYQNTVLWTVADLANESGYNVVCFAGGILGSPERFAVQRNAIFELVGPRNVDGLLIMAGTIGNEVGSAKLAEFMARYSPLPMCSIAVDLEGIPSVLIDNDTGMREAVNHLIDDHCAKRIAFIRGPEANQDAERRYRVYLDVLEQRGLAFIPELVATGDFDRGSGREAIRILVDERGEKFDAIAAASDAMALGAIEALGERNIEVPSDVAVVSFDDDEEARLSSPPLTTVRVPLKEQVTRATEILLAALNGRKVDDSETIHTKLVVRESCGCKAKAENRTAKEAQLAELSQARRRFQAQGWARMLSDMGEALITSFDLRSMVGSVVKQFPKLEIRSCFLSLYDTDEGNRSRSRMVLAYDSAKALDIDGLAGPFDSAELIPSEAMPERTTTYIVEPIFFEHEQLGFASFEAGPREGNIYEALRDQFSAAIKGAGLMEQVVEKDRERRRLVQYILDVTPEMHRMRPVADISHSILEQIGHLLKREKNVSSTLNGFLATLEDDAKLTVQAGTGRFAGLEQDDSIEAAIGAAIMEAMQGGEVRFSGSTLVIPLCMGKMTVGAVYLEGLSKFSRELDLVNILANQAAVAIQNIRLYEMATLDPLTGVYSRRFFDRFALREIKAAFRSLRPLALIMLDLDDLKRINDTAGHLAGDRALASMGRVLRLVTRNNDIVGRYGGDEFAAVLPDTDAEGAAGLGERIYGLLKNEAVYSSGGELGLRASMGATVLVPHEFSPDKLRSTIPATYFQGMTKKMIEIVDGALYQAKRSGRNRLCRGQEAHWPEPR